MIQLAILDFLASPHARCVLLMQDFGEWRTQTEAEAAKYSKHQQVFIGSKVEAGN